MISPQATIIDDGESKVERKMETGSGRREERAHGSTDTQYRTSR